MRSMCERLLQTDWKRGMELVQLVIREMDLADCERLKVWNEERVEVCGVRECSNCQD